MNQELKDFEYFRDCQLYFIDYATGRIDVKKPSRNLIFQDVGSRNSDGYVRLWCGKNLRMKHRLIYFLYHGELPGDGEEIDHFSNVRDQNWISNLRVLIKSQNNLACVSRKIGRRTPEQIHKICRLLQNTHLSDEVIANQLGYITRATVRDIKTRRSRKAIGSQYAWSHRGY